MCKRTLKMSAIELGIGITLIAVLAAVLLPGLTGAREASSRASCQNNLKQWGIVCKMFAGENKGNWPPLSPVADNWFPDMKVIYPEYLSDLQICICPSSPFSFPEVFRSRGSGNGSLDPECVSSLYYNYTGLALWSDEQALGFYAVYGDRRDEIRTADVLEVITPIWANSDRIEQPFQAGTPVMWDRMPLIEEELGHKPGGINVLHMDGHVTFVKYSPYNNSNFFPATRAAAETFGSVLPRLPGHCYGP